MGIKKYYFGNNENSDFELFSVLERPNPDDPKYKDIQLHFPNKGLFFTSQDFNQILKTENENQYSKTESPHISIHYNPTQEYLLIKKTLVNKKIFQVARVKDVRDNIFFAPVMLKIFGDTSRDCYKPKTKHIKNSTKINVNYNSKTDTLIMFFLVTKKGNEIYKDPEYPGNFYEIDFGDFRLVVIYRYFNRPSLRQTINLFLPTPDNIVMNGLEWWQVCNLLNDLQASHIAEYFKLYPERNH